MVADERYCVALPGDREPTDLAPLLCAGLIGYRALWLAGGGERLGLYGFGSSAHILCQVARSQGRRVFAFVRPGDDDAAAMARQLGAEWAGSSDETPPERLDAAIVFAPIGALMVTALEHSAPGAVIVSAGIHMSDIPSFPYRLLWEERSLRSVANLTRADAADFFTAINGIELQVRTDVRPLSEANTALDDLRNGRITGSAVLDLRPDQSLKSAT